MYRPYAELSAIRFMEGLSQEEIARLWQVAARGETLALT
jgi:hypothetical protein